MRNYANTRNLGVQIKAGLQVYHREINKNKYSEKEFGLFYSLAELYLQRGKIREYPKVVAIYQYLKKLVEKRLNNDQEKQVKLDEKIGIVEKLLIEKVAGKKVSEDYGIKSLEKVRGYKENLDEYRGLKKSKKYRHSIKAKLKEIENLGVKEEQEELDDKGLIERSKAVEAIYVDIREFFIGKRDKVAGELTKEKGLINKLIEDSIEELGGLPKVKVGDASEREVEYAIFGMGSMALGTMTPWSDLEFGILIEEGLKKEEDRVKEYFRNLTILLHLKVVNFGETPLRVMGIEELNNFKIQEETDQEHNWFRDNLINSGVSFDGPHWHACKTPLGRAAGYIKETDEEMQLAICEPYELISNISQLQKMSVDNDWYGNDGQLLQALRHVIEIRGSKTLVEKYRMMLKEIEKEIVSQSFAMLRKDIASLDPFYQVLDKEKEGQIINVKKEIYRFPDRMMVALRDCLRGNGNTSWEIIRNFSKGQDKRLNNEGTQNLLIALSIATEVRLRTYANNNEQREDVTTLAKYESNIKEIHSQELALKAYHLKDIKLLYHYYYIVLGLSHLLKQNISNIESMENECAKNIFIMRDFFIKGYVYKKFMQYSDALREFKQVKQIDHVHFVWLSASLYFELANYEEALELFLKAFDEKESVGQGESTDGAKILYDIGSTLHKLNRFEEGLKFAHDSLKLRHNIYLQGHVDIAASLDMVSSNLVGLGKYEEALIYSKESLKLLYKLHKINNVKDDITIAASLTNLGSLLEILGKNEEAFEYTREGFEMMYRIYKGDHYRVAGTLNNVGAALKSLGRYSEALTYQQEGLNMMRRIYQINDPRIIIALNNVSYLLNTFGRYEEALKYSEEALEIVHKVNISNDLSKAISLDSIGVACKSLGRPLEALRCWQESLEIRRRIFKSNHPDIASTINAMSGALRNLSRYEESLHYAQESLDMMYRIFTGNHIKIASSLDNIGTTYSSLGKYEEALRFRKESLKMMRNIFKEDNMSIANVLNNIGITYRSLSQYEEALSYYKDSLKIRCEIFKDDHPDIASSFTNIRDTLREAGKYEEAEEYEQRSLNMKRRIFKGDHPDVASSLNNLGITFQKIGNYNKALKYYKKSLEMRKRIYRDHHIYIAESLNNLGEIYRILKKYSKAQEYIQKSLDMKRRIFKGDHDSIANSLCSLGNTFDNLGKYEEALMYYHENLQMLKRIYKDGHSDIAGALYNIGSTLDNLRRYEEALEYYQKSLEMRRKINRETNKELADILNNIGITYENLGRYEEALAYYQENLAIRRKINKEANKDFADALNNLGTILGRLERYEEALRFFTESLEVENRLYNGKHEDIAATLNDISVTYEKLGNWQEAYNYCVKAMEMNKDVSTEDTPPIYMRIQYEKCAIGLGNIKIIEGVNIVNIPYYSEFDDETDQLSEFIGEKALEYWKSNELGLAISCYEVLSKKLIPQSRSYKHNLACAYHVKAILEHDKGKIKACQKYISNAREEFGRALNLKCDEETSASLHVEYAMFMLRYHDTRNKTEYSIIIANIMVAMDLKEDISELTYEQIDKITTIEPIQELLKEYEEVVISPCLLAYCLLIKLHILHDNKEQAESVLKEFIIKSQVFKEKDDEEIVEYLLHWCHRELESQKIQQNVTAQLNALFQPNISAIAKAINARFETQLQFLPNNHIGVIWDYYYGKEHRIACELRLAFDTASAGLNRALKRENLHVDIIISYMDEITNISEDHKTKVMTSKVGKDFNLRMSD